MSFTGRDHTFDETVVSNTDSFFPDIPLGDLQGIYRVPTQLAPQAITHELSVAMFDVNKLLAAKKQEWLISGFSTLSEVDTYDQGMRTTQYMDAVCCRAKAYLLRDYQTFSRRDIAENMATDGDDTTQFLWAKSDKAVRALLGISNIGVELL